MALKVRIEPASLADFNAAMKDFAKEVKVSMETVNRQQIRLMCRDAMTFTPPMPKGGGRGLSVAAHKAGMNKVGNDVRRIFVPQDQPVKGRTVFLRNIINAVKGNDTQSYFQLHQNVTESKIESLSPIMRKIMEDTDWQRSLKKAKNYLNKASIIGRGNKIAGMTNDFRGIHDRAKGAVGGRWPKSSRYIGPQYFAPTAQMLNAYIAERQTKVGLTKAGWAQVMSLVPLPLNRKGVAMNYGTYDAPWVDANKGGNRGIFQTSQAGNRIGMSVTNLIGNINNVSNEAGTENIVYGNRVKQIRAAVQDIITKDVANANRRGRRLK